MKRIGKKKRTVAQLAQQRRFALAANFLSPLKNILVEGFKFVSKRRKRKIHPFNLAMSQVLKGAITDLNGSPGLDPEKVLLSDGTFPGVVDLGVRQEQNRLIAEYNGSCSFGAWDDPVKLIAYQVEEGVACASQVIALRHESEVAIEIPKNLRGKDLLLYILVHDRDGLRYARSRYLGTFNLH